MADVQVNDEEMSSSPLASTEALEPTEVEQDTTAIVTDSDPGSLPLISEHGNPRFPRVLLDGGGYEILGMPINKGLPVWVTSVNALELHVSIEVVLLNLVDHALQNRDANWPELLRLYEWFPNGLLDISQQKRQLRWDWIMSKKPVEPVIPGEVVQQHCFWVRGYGLSKAKDDKLIEMDAIKALNYKSFRAILRQVANECITSTPGPVEIMGLCRRHWNDLKEPQVSDLRSRVIKKKKKIRGKNRAAKNKLAKKSSSAPSTTSDPQPGSQVQAGDPSPTTGPSPAEENEVVMLGEVRHPSGHPNSVPGMAPPPGVPIIRTPLLSFQQENPPPIRTLSRCSAT